MPKKNASRNHAIASRTGSDGVPTSPNVNGAPSAKTTANTEQHGISSHTITRVHEPIDGAKTGSWAYPIGANSSVLHWQCGTAKTRFSKNVCSVSPVTKAITAKTSRNTTSTSI